MRQHHAQRWPDAVMHRALALRATGLSIRATAARLAESLNPAPPVWTVRSWLDCTIKRAAEIMTQHPQPRLVWRESGHLSEPDAGYALCGGAVRFQAEVESVTAAEACEACLLRAEGASREYLAPVRGSDWLAVRAQMHLEEGI